MKKLYSRCVFSKTFWEKRFAYPI